MATYTWSASSNGNANVASNWTPNGVPTAGDTVQFAGNVPHECNWNIAEVSIMDIQSGFTGAVKFATSCVIATGLSINEERRINPSATVSITFNGTPAYHSNLAYVKLNCANMVAEDGLFDNLQFIYASATRTTIDAGKYPHMSFKAGFRTDYIAPSFSANKYNVSMLSITINGGNVSAPTSPSADDKLMNWTIAASTSHNGGSNQLNINVVGSPALFDGGAGTWTFQAKTSGFTFPVTGSPIYNGWSFAFENVIIDGTANGSGGRVVVNSGAIVRLTNLTINSGCSMKGHDIHGATIHLVNRPKIRGTWGFLPIADGIYYYKGIYNLGVSYGGTGLISVASGAVPFGNNAQKLSTNGTFNFNDSSGTLTIGEGGMIITAGSVGSPAANQLWVNAGDSNKLYFGSSEVGGGGGGSSTVDVVSNVATNTILGRNDSGSGNSEELTPAEVRTMLGIEAGSTADQTNAEIRTAVEAASDSNVFTDADHSKLNGISAGATAYTDANAIAAVEGEATLDLTGDVSMAANKYICLNESTYASSSPVTDDTKLLLSSDSTGTNDAMLRINTDSGFLRMGPQNSGFCHFYTDRTRFYFNRPIHLDGGSLVSYDEDLQFVTDGTGSNTHTRIYIDAGVDECRVGIGNGFTPTNLPKAELDVAGAVRFRAPVEVIATDPAPAIIESGTVFGMTNSGAINFTLPAGAPAGTQFIVINTLGNDITIRLADANDKLNGATNGTVLATTINNGTTIVCIGDVGAPASWYVMGGI